MQSACWDAVHEPTVERPELAGAGNEKQTEHDEMSLAESKETTLVFHNSNFIDGLQSSFKIRPVQT